MQRLQALYEEDVVPVREIARVADVTERTLYRYIQKGAWRRRHACPARDAAGAAAKDSEGGLVWDARFAPVKGAGGRFIRREDTDKPVARGIKALDPVGAARAVAKAESAAALSARAGHMARLSKLAREGIAAQKKRERAEDARIRAFGTLMDVMNSLTQARRAPHVNLRADAVAEKMQHLILEMVEKLML
jgi:hypothetical protein